MRRASAARAGAWLSALGSVSLWAASAPTGLPTGVKALARGDGWAFADSRGMTLYTFDRDEGTPGQSSCKGECATLWPPLAAPADARPGGDWSIITRDDKSGQWAFRGRPVYRYALDAFAGATFGDGVATLWHVAFQPIATPREIGIGRTVLGQVLTDNRGRTLYSSKSACEDDCLKTWEPVAAPALANGFADWSIVTRDSGLRQWAYKGQALYRRPATDIKPGEITGDGARGWAVMVLEPAPPLPPWATVQASDAGELIANAEGLTVYAHGLNARGQRRLTVRPPGCDVDDCVDAQWVPFLAAPDARPIGSWALVRLPGGKQQWSYKGQKLYTNVLDKKPGDFKGIRFGGDRTWSAIMRSGEPMQGVSVGG
jgi:predicted lipoprotein with Yx(FWY)xxD motif